MQTFTQSRAQRQANVLVVVAAILPWLWLIRPRMWRGGLWSAPMAALGLVCGAWVALFLYSLLDQRRRCVTLGPDGVTSRTMWRTRLIPWPTIVRVEPKISRLGIRSMQAVTPSGRITLPVPYLCSGLPSTARCEFDASAARLVQAVNLHQRYTGRPNELP